MTLGCSETRERFPRYAAEELSSEERAGVRDHLAGCSRCVREAVESDPSLVFMVPAPEAVSAEESQAILSAVRGRIAWKQTERRLAVGPARRRSMAVAAALLALLLGLPGSGARRSSSREAVQTGRPLLPPAAMDETFVPAAHPAAAAHFPESATVYDWKPGGGGPRVVWIVDRSLDL